MYIVILCIKYKIQCNITVSLLCSATYRSVYVVYVLDCKTNSSSAIPKSLSINDKNPPYLWKNITLSFGLYIGAARNSGTGTKRKDNGRRNRGIRFALLHVHPKKKKPLSPHFWVGNGNLWNLFIIMLKRYNGRPDLTHRLAVRNDRVFFRKA